MELVKAKKITHPEAKQQFCFWKTKQEAGPAKSFREKQVTTLLLCRSVMFLLLYLFKASAKDLLLFAAGHILSNQIKFINAKGPVGH